ncbi:MAG: hypothetical protein ACKVT0_19645 [Planctomycetaceae bacterium]
MSYFLQVSIRIWWMNLKKMNTQRWIAWSVVLLYGGVVLAVWLLEWFLESQPKHGHPMPGHGYSFLFRFLVAWPTSWGFSVAAKSISVNNMSPAIALIAAAMINALMLYWICFALSGMFVRIKKHRTNHSA